ncbi:MAG: shikimate dehydrogenase [Rhizobiales bacterium]|nr:shikimate dehydrogenase [Hyphomicrobiales bacterium]
MKRALVIGSPIAQSRSPLVHGYWLAQYGIEGSYERAEVRPEAVAEFLRDLPARGFSGCNVTIPNKEAAFAACDHLTSRAQSLGAVNTIWFDEGRIWGDNTDGIGFVAHLDQVHPGWDRNAPSILILGAGGAARGLALPLLERRPGLIAFSNRSRDRAEALIADIRAVMPNAPLDLVPWPEKATSLGRFDLVINTTSAGMLGKDALDLPLDQAPFHTIIADIVYVPLETALLAEARRRGLRTLDGLGMLLHQAVPGFEKWFGRKPEVSEKLREHVIAHLPSR